MTCRQHCHPSWINNSMKLTVPRMASMSPTASVMPQTSHWINLGQCEGCLRQAQPRHQADTKVLPHLVLELSARRCSRPHLAAMAAASVEQALLTNHFRGTILSSPIPGSCAPTPSTACTTLLHMTTDIHGQICALGWHVSLAGPASA